MQIIAQILIFLLFPVQFAPAALVFFEKKPYVSPEIRTSRVEGVSDEKPAALLKPQSVRGSISELGGQHENEVPNSGFLPERTDTFKPLKIFAGSSVVLDADSGTILHYENGRTRSPIASLTKVMTAVVVLENVKDMDEIVRIDEEALKADGTRVGCPTSVLCIDEKLHLGEKITVKDLLTAMLMVSANDAAVALAKHVAGSQQKFAGLMNAKAKELNLSDTHFCNPSGLDIDGCYSSAYDFARIAIYSLKYENIWKIMRTEQTKIASVDGKYEHNLKNTDILLGEIPNCMGGKTGFTYNAGKSLMLGAADPVAGKHKILAVILNDNNRWDDMKNLLNWTFENYEWK